VLLIGAWFSQGCSFASWAHTAPAEKSSPQEIFFGDKNRRMI
jgi:hypothetical protein